MSPFLTDDHKMKRLACCLENEHNEFSNYLFVDETTVRLIE